jgi:hypothetical protein
MGTPLTQGDNIDRYDARQLLGSIRTELWLPQYRSVARGPWSIRRIMMAAARAYWGKIYQISGAVILCAPGDQDKASWMSMVPFEIESQEIGLSAARGHTVVLGLGMGWGDRQCRTRANVDRVTVIERDPDVIALVEASGIFDQLPQSVRDKVDIIQADALTWRPSTPVDSLQADIWEKLVLARKLDDVRHMQDNIGAASLYFWGQEMEFWRFACRRQGADPQLDWPLIRGIIADDIQLPLSLPDWPDYPQKIAAAAPWWTPREPDWWR